MIHFVQFYFENKIRATKTVQIPSGTLLTVAASEAGILFRTDCGGAGTCGKCKVKINSNEQLACQTVIENDLDVIVPESALRHDEKPVIVQAESFLDDRQHDVNVIKRTGHCFGTTEATKTAVTKALNEVPVDAFQDAYRAWKSRWQMCVDAQGNTLKNFKCL